MKDILVIGSFMMDQVVTTSRAPESGETIIGEAFNVNPGGKGANQAVAAARLGTNVKMIGKVGNDNYGQEFIDTLKNENIDVTQILKDPEFSTGVGFITKESNGENRIIVVPGANMQYTSEELMSIEGVYDNVGVLVMQLEMQIDLIEKGLSLAKDHNVQTILNPAPAQKLSKEVLMNVDYLTPNESELELLTGKVIKTDDESIDAAKELLKFGVKNVIVTLGDRGALLVNEDTSLFIKGHQVKAVDTVAAGDSFNGALAVGLVKEMDLNETIMFANAVGALTVQKHGAINSLPTQKEVSEFLETFR